MGKSMKADYQKYGAPIVIDDRTVGVLLATAEHLTPIYEETMLLQQLVEDLRLLSLADAGQLWSIRSSVDVTGLLSGVAEGAGAVAEDKGILLRVDVPQMLLVVDGEVDRRQPKASPRALTTRDVGRRTVDATSIARTSSAIW